MRRLLTLLACLFVASATLADPPKKTYTDIEYAELMTAATYAGALTFCASRQIHRAPNGTRFFSKVRDHVVPLIGTEGLSGEVASAATELLMFSATHGRFGVFKYLPDKDIFYIVEMSEVRSANDCEKVATRAEKMTAKGRLLDNEVGTPL